MLFTIIRCTGSVCSSLPTQVVASISAAGLQHSGAYMCGLAVPFHSAGHDGYWGLSLQVAYEDDVMAVVVKPW